MATVWAEMLSWALGPVSVAGGVVGNAGLSLVQPVRVDFENGIVRSRGSWELLVMMRR